MLDSEAVAYRCAKMLGIQVDVPNLEQLYLRLESLFSTLEIRPKVHILAHPAWFHLDTISFNTFLKFADV